jgi:hypothetical protein
VRSTIGSPVFPYRYSVRIDFPRPSENIGPGSPLGGSPPLDTNIRQRLEYSRRAFQAGDRSRAFEGGYQCGCGRGCARGSETAPPKNAPQQSRSNQQIRALPVWSAQRRAREAHSPDSALNIHTGNRRRPFRPRTCRKSDEQNSERHPFAEIFRNTAILLAT